LATIERALNGFLVGQIAGGVTATVFSRWLVPALPREADRHRRAAWGSVMKTVIFACVHNAGRSQIAAALFNALVDPAAARAVSAGTNPGERVHPEVVEVMRDERIDLSSVRPQRLTEELASGAHVLVTMGCGDQCPYVPGLKRQDWPLEDPKGKPVARVREIRDDIRQRVLALIAEEHWGLRTVDA
jgi:arsenate reductase